MRLSLIALAVSAVLLAGCDKGGDTAANSAATPPPPAATPAAPAATPAAPAAAPVAAADKVGIAACDDYLEKYHACIADKVPAEARSQFESSLAATRASWKSMAGNAAASASLESACKQAIEGTRQAMSVYGCTF